MSIPHYIIERIDGGESVVYPTSTLPGLGCVPTPEALDIMFELKGRQARDPVSIAVTDLEMATDLVSVSPQAVNLLASFPRGSLTLLLPAHTTQDPRIGGDLIAIRVVEHPLARQLISLTGPLTATSANISGVPCASDCATAARSLNFNQGEWLDGDCHGGAPSTLLRFATEEELRDGASSVIIMREGVVPKQDVIQWLMTSS